MRDSILPASPYNHSRGVSELIQGAFDTFNFAKPGNGAKSGKFLHGEGARQTKDTNPLAKPRPKEVMTGGPLVVAD